MRDSVLLPRYVKSKGVQQRGCHSSFLVEVFLFRDLTELRVLFQRCMLHCMVAPPPTSCTHGNEHIGQHRLLLSCRDHLLSQPSVLIFSDVAPFEAFELEPPLARLVFVLEFSCNTRRHSQQNWFAVRISIIVRLRDL